jgi:hypothetical protein
VGEFVGAGGGFDPAALVTQLGEGVPPGPDDQFLLRVGVGDDRVRDRLGLLGRELAGPQRVRGHTQRVEVARGAQGRLGVAAGGARLAGNVVGLGAIALAAPAVCLLKPARGQQFEGLPGPLDCSPCFQRPLRPRAVERVGIREPGGLPSGVHGGIDDLEHQFVLHPAVTMNSNGHCSV